MRIVVQEFCYLPRDLFGVSPEILRHDEQWPAHAVSSRAIALIPARWITTINRQCAGLCDGEDGLLDREVLMLWRFIVRAHGPTSITADAITSTLGRSSAQPMTMAKPRASDANSLGGSRRSSRRRVIPGPPRPAGPTPGNSARIRRRAVVALSARPWPGPRPGQERWRWRHCRPAPRARPRARSPGGRAPAGRA